jgi:gliding motility associated protien GldN
MNKQFVSVITISLVTAISFINGESVFAQKYGKKPGSTPSNNPSPNVVTPPPVVNSTPTVAPPSKPIKEELQSISGLDKKSIDLLLKKFKPVESIRTKSIGQLSPVIGKAKAKLVFDYFAAQAAATPSPTNSTNPASNNIPPVTVVVTGDTSAAYALGDPIKPSLRNGGLAIPRNAVKERKVLPWEDIRDDDAVYSQIVWRMIDAREKINKPFTYNAQEDDGDQRFISILIQAIMKDSIVAFDPNDDRFTTPYTKDEVLKSFSSLDSNEVADPVTGATVKTYYRRSDVKLDSVYQFKIKEQWVFDKESSRMYVRIIGICPMARVKQSTSSKNYITKPLFWIYYPDIRAVLAKHDAYNGKNYNGKMTWEDVFESRYFSGYITKTTLDNPTNQTLENLIKDPLMRLYEGEKIKESLFNYEQDLWAY